jgi:hypothetical protein
MSGYPTYRELTIATSLEVLGRHRFVRLFPNLLLQFLDQAFTCTVSSR